jgi:hypothetical protein
MKRSFKIPPVIGLDEVPLAAALPKRRSISLTSVRIEPETLVFGRISPI